MRATAPRRIAVGLLALSALLEVSAVVFVYLQHRARIPARYEHSYVDALVPAIWIFGFAGVGALILSRQPRNRIGWVFSAIGVGWALAIPPGEYARFALFSHSAPFGAVAAWLDSTFFLFPLGLSVTLLLMWFPDGELPSRRWRILPWATVTGLALGLLGSFLLPSEAGSDYPVRYAWRATGTLEMVAKAFSAVAIVTLMASIALSVAALVTRYRRTRGEDRQRIRLFVWGAAIGGALILLSFPMWAVSSLVASLLGVAAFVLIPLAATVAILRYRLYDIDVVINRTVVFGALAAFITLAYVGIVVGIGSAIGERSSVGLSIAATAMVAIAFHPVQLRVQRFANRLVYGRRATPYEVMTDFVHRIGGTLSVDDALPRLAETAALGVGAAGSRVHLILPNKEIRSVRWPAGSEEASPTREVPVVHRGEEIGQIAVTKPAGQPLTPGEERLLEDLASQAGVVLRNVRLTVELEDRLAEIAVQSEQLRVSRSRLVTARDAQRRQLERDIREGAQGQLLEIGSKLQAAAECVEDDPDTAVGLLDQLGQEANAALEGLRDLARGIFPPLLAEEGIRAALEAHIRKVGLRARIDADPELGRARFDPDTEAAVYFCCVQALQNVTRHAGTTASVVSLGHADGLLVFAVRDEGIGFDPATTPKGMGLQIMLDRVEALGGTLSVESAPGHGTTVTGRVPAREEAVVG